MKIIISAALTLVLTLAFATSAFGQSSIDGYSDEASQIQAQVADEAQAPAPESTPGEGSLPFTGLDLGLMGAAGGLLLGAGLGMRRLTRAPGSA
jgi:hypothetical protein